MSETARLKVFRYDESMERPRYDIYEVPREKGQTVLQALFEIIDDDRHFDPPAFRRYQCNRGQCCSCLMTINGEIKRACTTEIEDEMVIEPLQDFPIIRDLIVDFGNLIDNRLIRKGALIQWTKPNGEIYRGIRGSISFREKDCNACGSCQEVCPINNFHNLNDKFGRKMTPPILFPIENDSIASLRSICSQCDSAPCMHFCPTKTITRDHKTGAVSVDGNYCIGCGMCLTACPNDAVFLNMERGIAVKCELCKGEPLCVENCPTGALNFFLAK